MHLVLKEKVKCIRANIKSEGENQGLREKKKAQELRKKMKGEGRKKVQIVLWEK